MLGKIMQFVFKWEGGYVNDPNDPGGETNWGISKRSYPFVDIKNLTKQQAQELYKKDYWEDKWETLGFPLAACMMDTSINMGKRRAETFLRDCDGNYNTYIYLRELAYLDIIAKKPSQAKYKNGWFNRTNDLRKFIAESKGDFDGM